MRCNWTTKNGERCRNSEKCCHHTQVQKTKQVKFNFINDAHNVAVRPQTYCGLNLLLPDDYDVFGTRNKCLKKGVGIGMGLSDRKRAEFLHKPYVAPPGKLYCGDNTVLPPGYTGFGNLQVCLKKGVGVGLSMDQDRRLAFQAKPKNSLGKKELMTLANRLGITNPAGKTRDMVEDEIAAKIIQ